MRPKKVGQLVIGPSCKGCVYLGFLYNTAVKAKKPDFCDYLGITGHRRPCPAGAGCTEKKTVRRRRAEA